MGEVRNAIDPVGSRVTTDIGQNPGVTSGIREVVMASLKTMQNMQTPMAARGHRVDCRVVRLLRGGKKLTGAEHHGSQGRTRFLR